MRGGLLAREGRVVDLRKSARQQSNRRRAFTLVEVLLVLVILVIIGSIAVTAYGPIQRRAYINAARSQIKAFKTPLSALSTGYWGLSLYCPGVGSPSVSAG